MKENGMGETRSSSMKELINTDEVQLEILKGKIPVGRLMCIREESIRM
jgi:hypothetical protein